MCGPLKFLCRDNGRLFINKDTSFSECDLHPVDLPKIVTIEEEQGEYKGDKKELL